MRQTSRAVALLLTLESARGALVQNTASPTGSSIIFPDWASQFNAPISLTDAKSNRMAPYGLLA